MNNKHSFYLTGVADEAGPAIETQIRAQRELGWTTLELRHLKDENGQPRNSHDVSEAVFEKAADALQEAGITVCCFDSGIADGKSSIHEDFEIALGKLERTIPRMKRLGAIRVRIMSYPMLPDGEDQLLKERFRRMNEIVKRFGDEGIQVLHENCRNYGGRHWDNTLRMLDNVPGLKLIYDTANPLAEVDWSKPEPHPKLSSWEFYKNVRDHVVHVHIKDRKWTENPKGFPHCYPDEGIAEVERILSDLIERDFQGAISIEPHMFIVKGPDTGATDEQRYDSYVKHGKTLIQLMDKILAGREQGSLSAQRV
jgi:sugar phosphate isomerase/epimerase